MVRRPARLIPREVENALAASNLTKSRQSDYSELIRARFALSRSRVMMEIVGNALRLQHFQILILYLGQ